MGASFAIANLLLGYSSQAPKQVSGGPERIGIASPVANRVVLASFVGSETTARLLIDAQGNHEWAGPGYSDQDTLLGWSAPGKLNLSGQSGGGFGIVRWTSPGILEDHPRIVLENDGSGIKLGSGTAPTDVRLGRSTAGILNFYGDVGFGVLEESDNAHRVFVAADGSGIKFGSGAAAPDARIFRGAGGQVNIEGDLSIAQASDAYARLLLDGSGLTLGPGSIPGDVSISRSATNVLQVSTIVDALGHYRVNGTQVVGAQQAAISPAGAVSGTATEGGWGFATAAEFNNFVSGVNTIKDAVNNVIAALEAHGLIA